MSLAAVTSAISSRNPWFAPMGGPDWTLHELPTGHWPMLSEPARLADMLAQGPRASIPAGAAYVPVSAVA
jgi:hypothetical protein